jgi:hypothetical protein
MFFNKKKFKNYTFEEKMAYLDGRFVGYVMGLIVAGMGILIISYF